MPPSSLSFSVVPPTPHSLSFHIQITALLSSPFSALAAGPDGHKKVPVTACPPLSPLPSLDCHRVRQGVPRKGPSAAWHACRATREGHCHSLVVWHNGIMSCILFSLLKVTRYIFRTTPASKESPGLNRQTTASADADAAAADPGSLLLLLKAKGSNILFKTSLNPTS